MSKGRIKRLITDRGFGFIETSNREDLFFHCSKLRKTEFADLHENQIVEFDVAQFPQGLQAVNVRSAGSDIEENQDESNWEVESDVPSGWDEEPDEILPEPDEILPESEEILPESEEIGPLTQREELLIRLAVSITRGAESGVRDQLDAARQLGIDRATLSAVVDRVTKANADSCRAVVTDHL